MNWEEITEPRRLGGFGVRVARTQNTALLGKLVWDTINGTDKLWVSVLSSKYLQGGNLFEASHRKGSLIWSSITKALGELIGGFKMKLGSDGHSSFWHHSCLSTRVLCHEVEVVYFYDLDKRICDVWNGGDWALNRLYTPFNPDLMLHIQTLKPFLVDGIPNTWVWTHTYSGQYTARSGYTWLHSGVDDTSMHESWSWLWKLHLPANIQFLLWQVCREALPTCGLLHRRGVTQFALCPRCLAMEETLRHCIFECGHVVALWRKFGIDNIGTLSNSDRLHHQIRAMISTHGILPAVVIWVQWRSRNQLVFEQKVVPLSTQMTQVDTLLQDITKAYRDTTYASRTTAPPLEVSWKWPEEGWVALNVDGSALTNLGRMGFGGLVRNADGEFLAGFYGNAGISHIGHAEMLVLLPGIRLCKGLGFDAICCYSDSANIVRMILEGVSSHHQEENEVVAIKQLMEQDWRIDLQHISRERGTNVQISWPRWVPGQTNLLLLSTLPLQG